MPKITVLLLNWNNAKDTIECLNSLQSIASPPFEVLVIDNGSSDNSVDQIKEAFPSVHILQNKANLGFAEGNNRGITYAINNGADFLFLLNNDTIVHPQVLAALLEASEKNPSAGVFGAKIYYYDEPNTIWYAGGDVHPSYLRCIHEGCGASDLEKKWETVKETNYACGCALFIKKEAVAKAGLMDPRFFLIWEEVDWCWRIRKAGYSCLFVPEAKLWHKISASFDGGYRGALWNYYYFRNRLLFFQKNYPLSKRLPFYLKTLRKEVFAFTSTLLNPKAETRAKESHKAALRGTIDYFLRKFGEKKE